MDRIDSVPSGIRLQRLIQSSHTEILGREKDNNNFIYLYNIGTYWVAFEQSAYRLDNLFPRCELTLFRVSGHLEYVVMASVSSDEAAVFLCKHIIHCDRPDYKVLVASPFLVRDYYKWHLDAVRSVL
ncbi:hypothetical protein [Phocaeicola sp.]